MKAKYRVGIGIIVLSGIVAILVRVRMKREWEREHAPLPVQPPIPVQVATVRSGAVEKVSHVLGTVLGMEETEIAPRVLATIVSVTVREGAQVRKGQLLVTLDDREFQDAVAQAEAAVAAAQVAYEAQKAATARDRTLFEVKAIAQEQWDWSRAKEAAAKSQLEAAQKQLDLAKTRLSYCQITAPFDGVITARLMDPGDLAVPGRPILKMVPQRSIRVRAALPSEDFVYVQPGTPVLLQGMGHQIQTQVTRLFPAMSSNHLAQIECELTNPPPGWVSGARIGVDVVLRSGTGLQVPNNALLESETGTWIFLVRDGKVHVEPVQVILQGRRFSLVKGRLQVGDTVVVGRPSKLMVLSEGAPIIPISSVASAQNNGETTGRQP